MLNYIIDMTLLVSIQIFEIYDSKKITGIYQFAVFQATKEMDLQYIKQLVIHISRVPHLCVVLPSYFSVYMCNFIIHTDKEVYEKNLKESQDNIMQQQGRYDYGSL